MRLRIACARTRKAAMYHKPRLEEKNSGNLNNGSSGELYLEKMAGKHCKVGRQCECGWFAASAEIL